jgi:hypothetical protein
MSEEDEELLTWDELLSSVSSSVLYWRYRRLIHEKAPPSMTLIAALTPIHVSYSPSGRWALYVFLIPPDENASRIFRWSSIYRVIPIGYSDDVALQHQLSLIKQQQQLESSAESHLSLKECFDEARAMGDLLAVPHNPSLSSSSCSFPIWRYSIQLAQRPSWYPREPSTLIVDHYNNIIEDRPPLPTNNSNGESNQQYASPATVTATATTRYRLPQRDIDKSIWIAMIAKGTFDILLTALVEIIFEYSDS